jgi:peptidyl-prolyl cis-trans isomerase SurA
VSTKSALNVSMIIVALAFAAPLAILAQLPDGLGRGGSEDIDRVIAVVGDSAITLSQVTERMFQMGDQLPTDSVALAELQTQLLEALVNEQLLLQAAISDTLITVDDSRIDEMVDLEMEERTRRMGGQSGIARALSEQGWTLPAYREYLKNEARKQNLQQQFLAHQAATRRAVIVEEAEMREFFDAQLASLPERPATITFANIVVDVEATDSAKAVAKAEAERLLELVVDGDDFEALAQQYSDDPGSKQIGGDLGWFRRGGGFVKEFEDAAFELRPGQVSIPIETQFGYHLIYLERIRGPERKARHILITPVKTPEDTERARAQAQDLLSRVVGGEEFSDVQSEFTAAAIPDTAIVPMDQLAQLPPGYGAALQGASAGTIVGPIEFGQGSQTSFGIAKVISVREAGIATFEDVRTEIQQVLTQQKMQDEILAELRAAAHVEIRT